MKNIKETLKSAGIQVIDDKIKLSDLPKARAIVEAAKKPKKENEVDKDNFVPVACKKCKKYVAHFSAEDDHGGSIVKCNNCNAKNFISNQMLTQVLDEPENFELPLLGN